MTALPAHDTASSTDRHDDRRAGRPQGFLLMFMSCLPILGAVLLAPLLPAMQDHFGDGPQATALVPLTLTVPALFIAIMAPFAGRIVDRFGRKRLLLVALVAYAIFGTAPLWVDSLPAIIATRAGLGIAEGAIMTCCTTLIADYFSGPERDRWFGLQTVFASLSATVFIALGGILGANDWRTPFWLYASGLLFLVLAAKLIWQPVAEHLEAETTHDLVPLPMGRIAVPCAVTILGGAVFYTPIVQLPYLLDDAGVDATSTIGAIAALASAATALGAFVFGRVARVGAAALLPVAFGLAGIGLLIAGLAPSLPVLIVGAVVASLGTGLLLPSLLIWALSSLSYEQRGRGTGLWTAALFFGEFLCPLLILALTAALGGLGLAVVTFGVAALIAAAAIRLLAGRAATAA